MLPHVAGVVGDVVSGKGISESLRKRGRAAATDAFTSATDTAFGEDYAPPPAKRARKQKKQQRPKKKSKWS